jgi:O-antigen/teichoic acid export membrane protein
MSKVSRNIVYNGLGQGLGVILSFVAVRFVFRRLGGDALGLIYFSLAFSTALSVAVQLGICESAVREVASHQGNRPEYIKSFIRTSSTLYWIGYVSLAIAAYLAAPYLVRHWVKLGSMDALTAIKMMRILTLGALVALPGGLYRALLVGLQHMGVTNLIDVGGKALQQGGIFLILLIHGSLFHVAYWIAVSALAPVVVYWFVCTHFFSVRALLLPGFSPAVVKQNFGFASGLMTISLCSWMLVECDKVMVSKLLPLAELGLYTFARGAINQGMLLTGAINNAMFPHFSALHGAGETAELRSAYNKIQDLICFGTVLLFAAVPFAAIPLFSRVFDVQSAHLLLLPATFLCVGTYMNGTLLSPYVVSLAVGRPDIIARQNLVALFIIPPVSAIAIYWFGLNGAGFSWVVYHIYTYSYGLPRLCRECLGIAPRIWYGHVLRILGSALLIYGAAWELARWVGGFSILSMATAYGVGSIVYGAVVFWMMGDDLRQSLLDSLQAVRLKLGVALAFPALKGQ